MKPIGRKTFPAHRAPRVAYLGVGETLAAVGDAPQSRLATIRYGTAPCTMGSRASSVAVDEGVVVDVPVEVLGGGPDLEVWTTSRSVRRGRSGAIEFACDDELLFAASSASDASAIDTATRELYDEILSWLAESGYPHPLRIWNWVPRINAEDEGLERYRRFCCARSRAFEAAHGESFEQRLCASSAVGTAGGPLIVYLLATRAAGRHWENPRQVSAYSYPSCYGPRSPSFARATTAPAAVGGGVFVSGTASIVGHRSCHLGDAGRQVDETLCNLEQLLVASCGAAAGSPAVRALSGVKVYVRDPADHPLIASRLGDALGEHADVLYVHADICRAELLVEVEGLCRSEAATPSAGAAITDVSAAALPPTSIGGALPAGARRSSRHA